MARDLNKAMVIGRLGRDPEVRYTPDGLAVANFSIATSYGTTDKTTNEKKETTEWHRIVAFGKLGEICGEYLSKGKQVYIEGRLQTRSWEKDGVKRYTTEIVATDMQMLGTKDSANTSRSFESDSGNSMQDTSVPGPQYPEPEEDDIPF